MGGRRELWPRPRVRGSGIITELLGWRWIFLVSVPFIVVVFAAVVCLVPGERPAGPAPLDLAGALLLVAAPLLFPLGVVGAGGADGTLPRLPPVEAGLRPVFVPLATLTYGLAVGRASRWAGHRCDAGQDAGSSGTGCGRLPSRAVWATGPRSAAATTWSLASATGTPSSHLNGQGSTWRARVPPREPTRTAGPGYGQVAPATLVREQVPAPDGWTGTFTDPRLCAAVVDRPASNGTVVETGTDSHRLASTRARAEEPAKVS
ncbi:hypothetical protein GCM10010266_59130 [Streptomyces griseomycini]|nr:hypothetical protein GCM10010266_59130 [Streptomyces griseomycini]